MEKAKKIFNSEDLVRSLSKRLDESLDLINLSKFSQSLEILKVIEKRLEKKVNCGDVVDKDLILITLHCMALCYQSLGNFADCSTYLEACIFNVKKEQEKSSTHSVTPDKIRKIRYLCLLHIQLSDCFSKQSLHKRALESAKTAIKHSILAVRLCLSVCTEAKFQKPSKANSELSELYSFSSNTLRILYSLMNGKKHKKDLQIFTIRTSLGVQKVADWVLTLSLSKILEIKPITLTELKSPHSLKLELSKDFLFDKICLSIVCLFQYSQELFSLNEDLAKSKLYLQRSLKISSAFFPKTCPLFQFLTEKFTERFTQKKKVKAPLRSKSIRCSPKMQEVLEKAQKSSKKRSRMHNKVHSGQSSDTDTGITKSSQTQSESTIQNFKSLPKFEKTDTEPPLSESNEKGELVKGFGISSKELYGNYSEDEIDKYEYMPLRRD